MADLKNLTDDELRRKLMDAGLPVGPIVDSTRKVYIRKLQRLAGYVEDAPAAPVQQESESDEEEAPPPAATRPTRPMTAKTRSSPQKPSTAAGDSGEVRQRKPQQRKLDVSIEKEIQEPSSGGIGSILFKLLILLLICGVVFYVVGLSLDQEKLNLLTGGSASD